MMIQNIRWVFSLIILIVCLFFNGAFCSQKPKLSDFRKNIYSQFGEDGIIEKIFELIGTTSKVAIEFGAADGFSCSNTANLWTKDSAWQGILLEADKGLYQQVLVNVAPYNCRVLHRKVGISENSLEAILAQEGLGITSVDLLSIDIDGNDYYILESLKNLRPRIIICEYNASIPAHLDVYPHYNNHIGCSVAALQRIATEKGYHLIAITDGNCLFVCDSEVHKFSEFDTDREHMRIDRYISYIINDYKSCYRIIGNTNFMDAWGWSGALSQQHLYGDYTATSATVIRR